MRRIHLIKKAMIVSVVIIGHLNARPFQDEGHEGGGPGMYAGSWKLTEGDKTAKIKGDVQLSFARAGDDIKVSWERNVAGKLTHSEWKGKFDGNDYQVQGDPGIDREAYKKIDDRTLLVTSKKSGNVIETARIVVAPDGKSFKVTSTLTGQSATGTATYQKLK